tara:strand:- start:367 stop:618 length:252 start_codon:yes stop_codon:yes gene_type:complete
MQGSSPQAVQAANPSRTIEKECPPKIANVVSDVQEKLWGPSGDTQGMGRLDKASPPKHLGTRERTMTMVPLALSTKIATFRPF